MKIRDITNKQIWEKFITNYAPQSLFQSWNWGETVKKAKSSKSSGRDRQELKEKSLWRFGVYDKNNLIGVAQAEKINAKRGVFLHLRHGPIFSFWKREYLDFLLQYLKRLGKKENAFFIRISPLLANSPENQKLFKQFRFITAPIHSMDGEKCWILDLDKDKEIILGSMRKTTRYLIRQAEKIGVRIVRSTNVKDLDKFLILYRKTASRQQFVPHKGIFEEFTEFLADGQILLFSGFYKEELLAAALIIFYNNQAIYHHSASTESKIPVNNLLIWEAILEAKKRGKKMFNFWGIAPEEKQRHPWRGLTQFKKGFGGREIEYLHAQDIPLSPLYCATYFIEWCRRMWKGY
ncbi:peptidoglycan bridge formation glycyltransferase FemA/FemB family protein [Candidatus Gottesmanbacteria bacterium]|nr:peptidoglycan bridge formation glycyltransferase FemA/FemB family protein [Candidatus Gottesmanbacteria bacterium]